MNTELNEFDEHEKVEAKITPPLHESMDERLLRRQCLVAAYRRKVALEYIGTEAGQSSHSNGWYDDVMDYAERVQCGDDAGHLPFAEGADERWDLCPDERMESAA